MSSAIGLYQPKNPINVGSVLRAAYIYESKMVAISGCRYRRKGSDTCNAVDNIPLVNVEDLHSVIPYGFVPIAVDLIDKAIALPEYEHPHNAFYVFGSEDGILGRNVLSWCRDVVYIPGKACMNLACCVNVVLYDRMCKEYLKRNK